MPMPTVEEQREFQRKWISERRQKYIDEMGPCFFCGTTEDIQIHHIDPEEKETHRIWSWSDTRIRTELKKCVPLCRSCHNKLHGIYRRRPLVHGTAHAYRNYFCRCDQCRKAVNLYKKGLIEYSEVVTNR